MTFISEFKKFVIKKKLVNSKYHIIKNTWYSPALNTGLSILLNVIHLYFAAIYSPFITPSWMICNTLFSRQFSQHLSTTVEWGSHCPYNTVVRIRPLCSSATLLHTPVWHSEGKQKYCCTCVHDECIPCWIWVISVVVTMQCAVYSFLS
jgi:hypothetical protein